jgi:SAM-dependent methyltransferase
LSTTSPPDFDAQQWLQRWEAQQQRHLPLREERFAAIGDVVEAFSHDTTSPLLLDLGCGPGSLSTRLLQRLPAAHAVAVDADPLLLAIGRQALGDLQGRLHLVDADLRTPEWPQALPQPTARFDAVVSTTALHWLTPEQLRSLLRQVHALLRSGGVFVNGDHIAYDPAEQPRILQALDHLKRRRRALGQAQPGETWEQWWLAVESDPGLAALVAERNARWGDHPAADQALTLREWREALHQAGFTDVATTWQMLDDRVLVAVRP